MTNTLYLFTIILFISIIVGCILAHNDNQRFLGHVAYIIIVFGAFMGMLVFISLFSPTHSEYNYHTVYTNNIDATITVNATSSSLHNGIMTFKGGDSLNDNTKSDMENVQSNLMSGTITASQNGNQHKENFDHLIIKGHDSATKVTKIEYGTETRYPTLFGIYEFKDVQTKYKNVQVTLSDEKGSKELANLLDGK